MDIDFASNALAKSMASASNMQRTYGDLSRRLKLRLDLLYLADCLADVPTTPPPRRHLLTGEYAGHFAVDISGNWRLVFKPSQPVPVSPDGSTDLKAVTSITLIEVTDYH